MRELKVDKYGHIIGYNRGLNYKLICVLLSNGEKKIGNIYYRSAYSVEEGKTNWGKNLRIYPLSSEDKVFLLDNDDDLVGVML